MQTRKPLFRPEALRPRLAGFDPPPAAVAPRAKLAHLAKPLASKQADGMKETELLPRYIRDPTLQWRGVAAALQRRVSLQR